MALLFPDDFTLPNDSFARITVGHSTLIFRIELTDPKTHGEPDLAVLQIEMRTLQVRLVFFSQHDALLTGISPPGQVGDWRVRYSYRVVAADAVVDAFTHSDFHGGGTNSRGSEMGVDIGLAQGVALNFTYYNTQVETGLKDDRQRFQADLVIKFM